MDASTRERITAALRRFGLPAAVVVVAVALAVAAFGSAARSTATIGPATVAISLRAAQRGTTVLGLPPFGSVAAATHAGPLAAHLDLTALDLGRLEQLIADGTPSADTVARLQSDMEGAVGEAALKGSVVALVVGSLVAWALTRRRRLVLISTLSVAAIIVGFGGTAAATFDIAAFAQPRYTGALQYAPAAMALAQERVAIVSDAQRQLRSLAQDLAAYYGSSQALGTGESLDGTIRILHVSDLHIDPVGMQLALDLAAAYDVDLVIDTGDLSHFGTAAEAALAVGQLGSRPRVYVPGNHDAADLLAALAALPNVTLLDGETTTTVSGIRILGVGDPAGVEDSLEPDSARSREAGAQVALELSRRTASGEATPTIVAVHDPASGEAFEGIVKVVLSGHTHTPALDERGGTLFLNAGTTGGVHFSELRTMPHIPHGANVLYFSRGVSPQLVAIDQIEVYGTANQSSVRRTLYQAGLPAQD
jgi:predicted phosphodiesterase